LRVLVDEHLLDRGRICGVLGKQGFKLAREIGEPLGQRGCAIGLELAVREVRQSVALGADKAPAGGSKAGVEAKDDQPSRSSSSSGTS
jgi:hypothetical protein